MESHKIFNIDEAASAGITSDDIKVFLDQNCNGFLFQKRIERARHYSDLAMYYLEASYVCEEIGALGICTCFKVNWKSGYHPLAQFIIRPEQLESLHQLLFNFSQALEGDSDDGVLWLIENLEEYKDDIKKRNLLFPDLADDYFANLINGAYHEYESNFDDPVEFRDTLSKETPEHLFGFWKCMHSYTIQQDFYVSSESWIIPPESNLGEVLKKYSSVERLNFTNSSMFSLGGGYYLINENYVINIAFTALAKAFQCISHVFRNQYTFSEQHDWLYELKNISEAKISEFGDFVIFTLNDYNIILWNQYRLNFHDINLLNKQAAEIFYITSELIGLREAIQCDWSELDDESFEELCYDIIYYNPKYDRSTIRKMGKSRSRDGGRDIVVYTHQRLGYQPEKFIFQCKLLKPGSSLTASKVPDVSDIIDQYDAQGYGIFTSVVIDATLFDKIDAISKRKDIKAEFHSKYEMERTLSILPAIKRRYFKVEQL